MQRTSGRRLRVRGAMLIASPTGRGLKRPNSAGPAVRRLNSRCEGRIFRGEGVLAPVRRRRVGRQPHLSRVLGNDVAWPVRLALSGVARFCLRGQNSGQVQRAGAPRHQHRRSWRRTASTWASRHSRSDSSSHARRGGRRDGSEATAARWYPPPASPPGRRPRAAARTRASTQWPPPIETQRREALRHGREQVR